MASADAAGGNERIPSCVLTVKSWMESMRATHPAPRNKRDFMRLAYSQGYRCAHCQELMHWDSQTDHIVPWCLLPDDGDSNVQILCPNCHVCKSHDEAMRIRKIKGVLARIQKNKMGELEGVCWRCLSVVSIYFRHEGCACVKP
jgi:hypothetical protein